MPLAFPSPRTPPVSKEITFRDGNRFVPDYLAELMATIDTVRYTYSEAVELVNRRLVADRANEAVAEIMAAHFREVPR